MTVALWAEGSTEGGVSYTSGAWSRFIEAAVSAFRPGEETPLSGILLLEPGATVAHDDLGAVILGLDTLRGRLDVDAEEIRQGLAGIVESAIDAGKAVEVS